MRKEFDASGKPFAGLHSRIVGAEEGYRAVFAALNTPVFVADAVTGMLLDANRKAEEMVGVPVNEIRRMHHTDLHPEGERERIRKIFHDIVSSAGGTALVPVVSRKGNVLSVEVSVSLAWLGGKAVVIGIFEDISRKEQVEKALMEAYRSLESADRKMKDSFLAAIREQKAEMEERYRSFLEYTHGIAFRTLMDLTPVLFFGGVETITGHRKEDFISGLVRWEQLIHPEDMVRVDDLGEELRRLPGRSTEIECRILRKDGNPCWIHLVARSLCDESGRAVGIEGTIVDITDRKRIESLLHDSEEKYRTLVENLNIGVYRNTADRQGRFLHANAAFARILGYRSPEEIQGKSVASLYQDPDDRKAFLEEIREKGFVKGWELPLNKKDGTPIVCSVTGIANRNLNGEIRWIDGIIEDISERKKAEAAVQESEARYRTVFENTGTAMIVIEADTTISLVNNEYEKLTGYTKEETEGMRSWIDFMSAEERARLEEYHRLRRKKPNAAPKKYETRIVDRFGNEKDIFVTVDMIPGTGRSVASVIDITHQKRQERDLRESEAELIKQARKLEDYSTTLRILLKSREQDREEVEKNVLSNIHDLVFPYLEKLKSCSAGTAGNQYFEIIEKTLAEITESFARHLTSKQLSMTSKEIQIANLIREGKTTKDIAQMLNLSQKTIEFYRNSIRVKLGLKNKKSPLRSHLMGLP